MSVHSLCQSHMRVILAHLCWNYFLVRIIGVRELGVRYWFVTQMTMIGKLKVLSSNGDRSVQTFHNYIQQLR